VKGAKLLFDLLQYVHICLFCAVLLVQLLFFTAILVKIRALLIVLLNALNRYLRYAFPFISLISLLRLERLLKLIFLFIFALTQPLFFLFLFIRISFGVMKSS